MATTRGITGFKHVDFLHPPLQFNIHNLYLSYILSHSAIVCFLSLKDTRKLLCHLFILYDVMKVINGVRDLDVLIEQPCLTYEECLAVRRSSPLPMVLDECVDDIGRGGCQRDRDYVYSISYVIFISTVCIYICAYVNGIELQ